MGWGLPGWGILLLFLLTACSSEDYETGDGKYSYLIGEFGQVYTNSEAQFTRLVTDNGESVAFVQPLKRDWANTPDSLYRAYVQYERKADSQGRYRVLSIAQVMVLYPHDKDELKEEIKTDPVGWESMWVSHDRSYLNLALTVMVGDTGEEQLMQKVGVVQMDKTLREDGTQEYHLRLYHDQNGVPQYYSATSYVSIPLAVFHEGDELVLTICTYQGEKTKRMTISPLPAI